MGAVPQYLARFASVRAGQVVDGVLAEYTYPPRVWSIMTLFAHYTDSPCRSSGASCPFFPGRCVQKTPSFVSLFQTAGTSRRCAAKQGESVVRLPLLFARCEGPAPQALRHVSVRYPKPECLMLTDAPKGPRAHTMSPPLQG